MFRLAHIVLATQVLVACGTSDPPDSALASLPRLAASAFSEFGGPVTKEEVSACVPMVDIRSFMKSIRKGIKTVLSKSDKSMSSGLSQLGSAAEFLGKTAREKCGEPLASQAGKMEALGTKLQHYTTIPGKVYHDSCEHYCDGAHDMQGCLDSCDVIEQIETVLVNSRGFARPLIAFLEAWREAKASDDAESVGTTFGKMFMELEDKARTKNEEL
eukprot:TRINITY_DN19432_c0_g1_i1.p1 TRINITY_DN19432_c0_g1~~TRINITY_DN19432_c0_g1_i1.p1  ORF type:complete len:215 (-),score=46.74 TRINITY_DN19432_c0_g1_i1:319-963(-)